METKQVQSALLIATLDYSPLDAQVAEKVQAAAECIREMTYLAQQLRQFADELDGEAS